MKRDNFVYQLSGMIGFIKYRKRNRQRRVWWYFLDTIMEFRILTLVL